ncbi:hypothetical protein [Micromonospora sp. HM5-17]|jgi:hypothetical protein|uniref:hypothetical protein n=1 Tax=Micromonospora sp. HM5-17 TaxID=2487710 RepID=UPI000F4957FB|nr:hypothetical protein [Micromonospora sp. HM5-17]ROT32439.1 hypothetical protein EF879_12955 [Micromonospora sp. HM5-17]
MERVLYYFLIDVPRAMTIWVVLMGLAAAATVGLFIRPQTNTADSDRAGDADGPSGDVARRAAELRRARLAARALELHRYAEEVAVAAERSAVTAQRRRDEWLKAQEEAEAAWQAYEAADAAARRVEAAAVLPEPRTPRTPAEYADRERYLHRAAMAACCRKELSVLQLSDALAHRNGWDPRRHPVEQEIVLRRAARDTLFAAHRAAAERERMAWRDAEIAAEAARSLRQEAFTAAVRAEEFRRWLPAPGTSAEPTDHAAGRAGRLLGPVLRWRAARAG